MNTLFEGTLLGNDSTNVLNGEIDESNNPTPFVPVPEQMGYYNENDFDEDGQMGDEFHEFQGEDLLDNDFNE
mgnify:CR=1 FL=1